MKPFSSLFSPPVFPGDDESTRRSRILNAVHGALLGVLLIAAIACPFLFQQKIGSYAVIVALALVVLISRVQMHRRHIQLAGLLVVLSAWFVITVLVLLSGGVLSSAVLHYVAITTISGLLLGQRGTILVAGMSTLATLGMLLAKEAGYAFPVLFPGPPGAVWLHIAFSLFIASTALNLALRITAEALSLAKRAEETARESEERFREMAENIREVFWLFDWTDQKVIYVSPAYEEIWGRRVQDLYDHHEQWAESIHPEDLPYARESFARIPETGGGEMREYRIIRPDGTLRWISDKGFPIFGKEGQVQRIAGIAEDITEHKAADEALRLSEEKFSKAFWNSPTWVVLSSLEDGRYIEVNHTFLSSTGYAREEVIGRTSVALGIWEDPEDRERIIREIKATGSVRNVEVRRRTKSGERMIMLFSAEAMKMGDEDCLLSVSMDITDLRLAADALGESEAKFRILVEKSPLGVALIGSDGRYRYVNPKFQEIFGYRIEEVPTGKEWMERAYPDPQYRKEIISIWKSDFRELRAGEVVPRSFRVVCKDGSQKEVEFRTAKMETGDVLVMYVDITEQRRMEAQLQHAQKMEAIGTLAGGIAHDFNNLLMGIQGRASLMLTEMGSFHPHKEHLKGIEEYVKSAADLTKQLLGFARGGKYETRPADMNAIVQKTARMFGRTRKEIRVHMKLQEDLWPVEVDQGQMEQVFLNLYVNAWQAMPSGGDIYLLTENVVLDEVYAKAHQLGAPGRYVKVSVTDTGMGMDRKTLERIFEPFFTTKEMGRGVGLGLASAYGIARNHGGTINAYSEKGTGSTFNIYLPASEKVSLEESKEEREVLSGSETLLLVDDEEMILEVGRAMLEKVGYTVLVSRSGAEALRVYRERGKKIDLVILDMIMPDLGGGETFDRLKEINPGAKVLLSSGYSINGRAREILDRGCDGFIQKPFDLVEFSRKVRSILEGK